VTPATYSSARADLMSALGEPTWSGNVRIDMRATFWFLRDQGGRVSLYESGGAVWVETAHADDMRASVYQIEGGGALTPLPEVVDTAAKWWRERSGAS